MKDVLWTIDILRFSSLALTAVSSQLGVAACHPMDTVECGGWNFWSPKLLTRGQISECWTKTVEERETRKRQV